MHKQPAVLKRTVDIWYNQKGAVNAYGTNKQGSRGNF